MIQLVKVISGGQTGVDQAALRAAKAAGLETGGWMPLGFRTLDGCRPEMESMYGMVDIGRHAYSDRTYANARDSDATIRLARDFDSPGEICTLKAVKALGRQLLDVSTNDMIRGAAVLVVQWLKDKQVKVLNVAGNAEQHCPGIGAEAEAFLKDVFTMAVTIRREQEHRLAEAGSKDV